MEHLLHRDRELVGVPEDVASHGVAHEQDGDPGLIEDASRREVVRGEHREARSLGLPRAEVVDGDGHGARASFVRVHGVSRKVYGRDVRIGVGRPC